MGRITGAAIALVVAAAGLAVWQLAPESPPPAPRSDLPLRVIALDQERVAFGLERTPRELTLRSFSAADVNWFVRTGSRFTALPASGTIPPFGLAAVRVQPSPSLTPGLNAEHTWFNWRVRDGVGGHVMVALTALRLPAIEYKVVDAAGPIALTLNAAPLATAHPGGAWTAIPDSGRWKIGVNQLAAQAARFTLILRAGSQETTVTEARPMVTVGVDRDFGFITFGAAGGGATRSP